jgi:uroporphyrinogen-III synthase
MTFSHVLLSRPRSKSGELAGMLLPLGLEPVLLPAFDYLSVDASSEQPACFDALENAGPADLVLFTSPRAVQHGLAQVSPASLARARVAAIGPATAAALNEAGVRVDVHPARGFTSEALLEALSAGPGLVRNPPQAFILAAPGGRKKLLKGLKELGWNSQLLHVYRSEPAALDRAQLERLGTAASVLTVWTSANAMKSLSQRLPPAAWFKVCQGEWVVISERLRRLARAYGPGSIHLTTGPDNASIVSAVRALR